MFARLAKRMQQLETLLLAALLFGMILLSCVQIVLRNSSGSALLWADPAGRVMLLWLAMLGAVAAAHNNRHIAIDLLAPLLPSALKSPLRRLVAVLTAALCMLLAWHTGRFVWIEFESATPLLGMPGWIPPLIIPLSFSLMALRYLLDAFNPGEVAAA